MKIVVNTASVNFEIIGAEQVQYTSSVFSINQIVQNKKCERWKYNMAEYTAVAVQTVAPNRNVLFTETPVCGTKCIVHREGSGIVTVKGNTKQGQCRARYKVTFGGNIAIPTGGTVGAISLAIGLNGEAVASTEMIVTPAAVEQYFNVASSIYIDVPCGCCNQLSVVNTSTQDVNVQNANIIVDRVA